MKYEQGEEEEAEETRKRKEYFEIEQWYETMDKVISFGYTE